MCARVFVVSFILAFAIPANAQHTTILLWPHAAPEAAQTAEAEMDLTKQPDGGHRASQITNVTRATLTVYPPSAENTGVAAVVFPGGSFQRLSIDREGIDACRWLNSIGMTCVLVKYHVPEEGVYPINPTDLEDAQQAMRITRAHAAEWHIDPNRVGAVGFSAGANLAVLLGTHPDDHHVESTPAAPDVDVRIDARPNFNMLIFPGFLAAPDMRTLDPILTPNALTPPTFIIQAEDDKKFGKNSIVYYRALWDANIPSELHIFPNGGHGFAIYQTGTSVENWTRLANTWLHTIKILPTQ